MAWGNSESDVIAFCFAHVFKETKQAVSCCDSLRYVFSNIIDVVELSECYAAVILYSRPSFTSPGKLI